MSTIFWIKDQDTGEYRPDGIAQSKTVPVTIDNPFPVQIIHPDENDYPPVEIKGDTMPAEVPASTFDHGSQTATAGTRVTLATSQSCREVLITAKPANTGYVYVGGLAVSSTSYGKRLGAGSSVRAAVRNLNLIYIDVSVSAEGVDYLYVA